MILLVLLFFVALAFLGSVLIGPSMLGYDPELFWMLRLPRAVLSMAVGGGLSVAGAVVQASLGNPLAEPYTLGIASAAALGAVVGAVLTGSGAWLSSMSILGLSGTAFFAFLFSMGAIFLLVLWLQRSFRSATEVLLAGVVSGFFCTSLSTLILSLSNPALWASSLSWLLGSMGAPALAQSVFALILLSVLSAVCWVLWKPLDLIAVDDLVAQSSGVSVEKFRKLFFLLVAFITAVCVSFAGVIGFVGLVVPHFLRKLGVRSHLVLIPASFLGGALLLLIADIGSRTVARPSEIPVGIILALIGAPIFLFLTQRTRNLA
jgi:iron complex transport system permease protein